MNNKFFYLLFFGVILALSRIIPHPPNFTSLIALSFYIPALLGLRFLPALLLSFGLTDIIIGFPTETREEFEDTVDVVKKVKFDSAFIFKYSERPNTRAAQKFEDDVTEEEKKERIIYLNQVQDEIA